MHFTYAAGNFCNPTKFLMALVEFLIRDCFDRTPQWPALNNAGATTPGLAMPEAGAGAAPHAIGRPRSA